jgi:hypothetical protein
MSDGEGGRLCFTKLSLLGIIPSVSDYRQASGEEGLVELAEIYDMHGSEQDWDWLGAAFGGVQLQRAEASGGAGQVFRIVRLQVVEGTAIQRVWVLDQEGNALEGVRVARAWPDGPPLPAWAPPASRWHERGVYGVTNSSGEIGFGMGYGDGYALPSTGTSAVWVAEDAGPSDVIDGLGMLEGERPRHLDVTFQLQDVGVEPSSPPPPPRPEPSAPPDQPAEPGPQPGEEDLANISAKLDRVLELLERKAEE